MSFFISAYGLAVKHGYRGTEEEWLESLHGIPGPAGDGAELKWEDGAIWWRPKPADGSESTDPWQKLLNLADNGAVVGQDGKSAYEIARDHGFEGSEEEWLESLKGADGEKGADGAQGADGAKGADGYTPVKGVDYYTEEEKDELVAEVMGELPITKTEDGYTEIEGLREILSGTVVKEGNTITVTTPLEGGESVEAVIVLNDAGYPATITANGREVPWTWTGFDDTTGGGGTVEGTTYFYNAGDACEDITGGWEAVNANGSLTMGESAMTIFGVAENVYCELCLRTANKIDLTDYTRISFELKYDGLIENEYAAVGVTTSDTFASKETFAASTVIQESAEVMTYEVDVSGITGSYYVALFGFSGNALGTGYTVYQVWGV